MMTCDECRERLSAYLDGEAGDRAEAIREHSGSCDACREILESLRRLSARIRDAGEAPAPLAAGILRRIRGRRTAIPRLAAAAAVLAALLWAAVLLWTGNGAAPLPALIPSGDLSAAERRILAGERPSRDEWMVFVLSEGGPR